MADATQQQRLVLPVGSQADVEDESATLAEALLAIDSDGQVIGYSTDGGTTWIWPSGGSSGQRILLADGHATPFTFDDLLQMDDGSDFMWSDPE